MAANTGEHVFQVARCTRQCVEVQGPRITLQSVEVSMKSATRVRQIL